MSISMLEENPFDELPESLVEEMLDQVDALGNGLSSSFRKLYEQKARMRGVLERKKLLGKDSAISIAQSHPTSCGVDGSYAIEKLLYRDMIAVAAVAVEGLTPPSEKRHWPKPHHLSRVETLSHSEVTVLVLRALMIFMELRLAAKAPHDVVLIDGSITTPIIYLNQALNRIQDTPECLSSLLTENLKEALESYRTVLFSERTDKIFAGIPKYTTRREISKATIGTEEYEDRGLLTFILKAGEFVGPVSLEEPTQPWHLSVEDQRLRKTVEAIIDGLDELSIVYYRPYENFPALRIEIGKSIASNPHRLAVLFEALRLQCVSPSIMEPYPLYLADRMVKHLGTALPAIRRTTTQRMSEEWEDALGNMYLAMHSYRTDWGK